MGKRKQKKNKILLGEITVRELVELCHNQEPECSECPLYDSEEEHCRLKPEGGNMSPMHPLYIWYNDLFDVWIEIDKLS